MREVRNKEDVRSKTKGKLPDTLSRLSNPDFLCRYIMGPLPETEKGSKYVLVAADCFTKWVEGIPNQEAINTVAIKLVTCTIDEMFLSFLPT